MDFPNIVGTFAMDHLPPADDRFAGVGTISTLKQGVAFAPGWTMPHRTCVRGAIGDFADLPVELFLACCVRLPIVDVTTIYRTCRGMAAIFADASSPYARLLTLMARAWTDDVDDAYTLSIIKEMAAVPLETRAQTIRIAAGMAKVSPLCGSGERMSPGEWARVIEKTRAEVIEKMGESDVGRMVADLEVAGWHAFRQHEPTALAAFQSACGARLQDIPVRYWPDVLDAAVADGRGLEWLNVVALVEDRSMSFPCMSDRLSIAFAEAAALTVGGDLYPMLQERFGVTESQYVALLRPFEAERIRDMRWVEDETFAETWQEYAPTDPVLVDLAEAFAIQHEFPNFCRDGIVVEPRRNAKRRRNGDMAAEQERRRWEEKVATFFSLVEADAIRSVQQSGSDEAGQGQALLHACVSITKQMQHPCNQRAAFESILTMPQGYQPVLMERWAMAASGSSKDPEHVDLLNAVSRWRAAIVDQFLSRGEYVNAVRACVAYLHTHLNLARDDLDKLSGAIASVAPAVIEATPSDAWGAMLEFLLRFGLSNGERPMVSPKVLTGWTEVFLKNPLSRFVRKPHDDRSFCDIAGPIFAQLPDRKAHGVSKFDHFCNRLAIPVERRASVKAAVARGIASTIDREVPNLRAVIRQTLQEADFLDDASFVTALLTLRITLGRTPR